jgi:uncharacterized membrane protein
MRLKLAAPLAFVASLLVTAFGWARLPERVPVHFGLDGQPNRYGSRYELLLLGPGMVLFVWVLLAVLFRVDPKVHARDAALGAEEAELADAERRNARAARERVVAAVLLMLVLLHAGLVGSTAGLFGDHGRVIAFVFAVFLLIGGNYMGRVRPNWFVGIRTPWTLSDDEVWRQTHRLAARLMVAAGALLLLSSFLLRGAPLTVAMVVLVSGAFLPPVVASYVLWKRRTTA